MPSAIIVQNSRIEGSGLLGRLLEHDGFDIIHIHAGHDVIPRDSTRQDLLIVLGGPASANDAALYLRDEEAAIRRFVSNKKPVLGICLGAQLIAKSFGGSVYTGAKKEIGFYNDLKPEPESELFSGFDRFTAFHWHNDTFDLPDGAVRLVRSDNYTNQAFKYETAVGLQFHLEADGKMIRLWLDKLQKAKEVSQHDADIIRSDIESNMHKIENNMRRFYKKFISSMLRL